MGYNSRTVNCHTLVVWNKKLLLFICFNLLCIKEFVSSRFKSNSPIVGLVLWWPLAALCQQTFVNVSCRVLLKLTSFPGLSVKFWYQSAARALTAATITVLDECSLPAGCLGERALALDYATRFPLEELENINTPVTLCLQLVVSFENASPAERLPVIVSLNRQPRGPWPLPRQVRQDEPPLLRERSYVPANAHMVGNCGEWAGLKIVSRQIKKNETNSDGAPASCPHATGSHFDVVLERILALRNVWRDKEQLVGPSQLTIWVFFYGSRLSHSPHQPINSKSQVQLTRDFFVCQSLETNDNFLLPPKPQCKPLASHRWEMLTAAPKWKQCFETRTPLTCHLPAGQHFFELVDSLAGGCEKQI